MTIVDFWDGFLCVFVNESSGFLVNAKDDIRQSTHIVLCETAIYVKMLSAHYAASRTQQVYTESIRYRGIPPEDNMQIYITLMRMNKAIINKKPTNARCGM